MSNLDRMPPHSSSLSTERAADDEESNVMASNMNYEVLRQSVAIISVATSIFFVGNVRLKALASD